MEGNRGKTETEVEKMQKKGRLCLKLFHINFRLHYLTISSVVLCETGEFSNIV